MLQTAIFVDAGYLFAQGSVLIAGTKLSRDRLTLNVAAAPSVFGEAAHKAAPNARLLRIYWYDGLIRGGALTAEQTALGRATDVKLRLGMVNSRGEQKGVDSLIVTDLIELARNQAISDALILSGDEDIRVGVQVAQTFGVRIHLVGIKPALGSQSPDLVAEADTHIEWTEEQVGACVAVKPDKMAPPAIPAAPGAKPAAPTKVAADNGFTAAAAAQIAETLTGIGTERQQVVAYLDANRNALPADIDRPALAKLRDRLGRDLTLEERKQFRAAFANELRKPVGKA